MRPFHKLRGYDNGRYPKYMIAVDTETTTLSEPEESHDPRLTVGVAIYTQLNESLEIVEQEYKTFYTIDEFWDFGLSKLVYNAELYLFAHNWAFDYPVLDGFQRLQSENFRLLAIVDESPPVILRYSRDHEKITVIDTLNYFRQSLVEMGKAIGLNKLDIDLEQSSDDEILDYCIRDTEIVSQGVIHLCRFLADNGLVGLKHTVAALALSCYTNKFMKHDIYIDGDEERVKMTRQSYFGGRTEAFRIGRFKGPLYLIDINSQYPFVMRNHHYPTKTFTSINTLRPDDISRMIHKYCMTAAVQIDTDRPAFPKLIHDRICFPTGRFSTVLSTPELDYAVDHDLIHSVGRVILHRRAKIFTDYVDYFYRTRIKYKKAGNHGYQEFCKKLLNSLYGKFGQNGKQWERTTMRPRGYPGKWEIHDRPTGKTVKYMEIGGEVWEGREDAEARDSFPAIAAHVTAHGRILLQRTIDWIDRSHVYYCDTDSLLIDQTGYDRIKDRLDDTALGCWALEGTYMDVEIHGPKDYRFDDKLKIKGISKKAVMVREGLYKQLQFSTLKSRISKGKLDAPTIRRVMKELKRNYMKGIVDAEGVVHPFRLDEF